ncbi:MAG: DUF4365 domain-containing protein [Candidatus Thiodiazotropha sp. (ex Lucina aurantia)]|nr:DUF4365 domain-containing protein [Candidatus Thiodiazotropha taylori]MBV2097827.1 DUF4365 domain-containing protein [Candidatus Thiodiazotropha sp. (ex Codakia orbicularis)]MBV2103300.1 DUF4365 domain-containing protein [Candidatus Thiodiazotropha sp. (ex Lucina aurantia)]MBV2116337.1 DUF4365 domain-containing protein [Candidatus Thiodiazotropha sp. (ex Lucina aurantia)]
MSYRDSASFGKRQEYVVVAELLKRGFDVYMTLVDDQGIDCIIRIDDQTYIDIQIKARSKIAKQWNFFAAMTIEPKDNYFFIFYTEKNDTLWVMPSKEVVNYAVTNKNGKNKGKHSLTLPKSETTQKALAFVKYKGEAGFELLRNYNT